MDIIYYVLVGFYLLFGTSYNHFFFQKLSYRFIAILLVKYCLARRKIALKNSMAWGVPRRNRGRYAQSDRNMQFSRKLVVSI